jgi:hypothetical protein
MELSDIKIPIRKIGYNIKNLYKSIKDTQISLKKYNINYSKKQITNTSQISVIKIIKYLLDAKFIDNYITLEQHDIFNKILESKDLDKLNNWLNSNSPKLMDRVNQLIHYNKIPAKLLNPSIDNILINRFVELNILDYLLNKLDYIHSYTIHYMNIQIKLKIYSKTKTISKKILNEIIDRIVILCLYKSTTVKLNINIDIFMTPFKKKISKDTKILTSCEVNSGFTSHNYKICIYRKEELNKVLVHELIHYLELDLDEVEFPDFYNYFNLEKSNDIKLNEAYTEILALVFNSIIISKSLTECKKILNIELKFSLYQVGKILNLYEFMNAHDFFKPNTNDNRFKQTTSVFSYFIIKTILLFNIDTFLDLYYNKQINKYNFKDIVLSIIDPTLIGIIDNFIKYINMYNQDKKLFSNLRMTYHE